MTINMVPGMGKRKRWNQGAPAAHPEKTLEETVALSAMKLGMKSPREVLRTSTLAFFTYWSTILPELGTHALS